MPAGATLLRDGIPVGNAPTELRVAMFRPLRLTASLPGHQTVSVRVPARPFRRKTAVELRLSPEREPLQ